MNTQYTQLTLQEREKIFVLRARGKKATEIAVVLGRHKATISRELRRNRARRHITVTRLIAPTGAQLNVVRGAAVSRS